MAITKYYYADELLDPQKFQNTPYATHLAVENHFGALLFGKEEEQPPLNRIVYATDAYAFRKKIEMQPEEDNGVLNLPFMNYWLKNVQPQTERQLWNHITNIEGWYVPELETKFKMVPVTMEYEATVYFHQDRDLVYASSQLYLDDSNETILYPEIVYGDYCMPLPAFLGYFTTNFEYNASYNENDYLEQNSIYTLGFNFTLQSFFLYSNIEGFGITDEIMFNFLSYKGILDTSDILNTDKNDIYILFQRYFTETSFTT